MTFYERFAELCRDNNISPSAAAQINGINRSTVTRWKQKAYIPRLETVKKLSNYFEVTVEYLMDLENTKYRSSVTAADVKRFLFGSETSDKMWKEVLRLVDTLKSKQDENLNDN